MTSLLRRFIALLLAVSIAGLGFPPPGQAAIITTDSTLAGSDRAAISGLLNRAEVRARLRAHGVDAAELEARIAALSDEDAAQLAERMDGLPAGGDGIIGAIVLVFLVLLITDILGYTKVFPFTRPAR